jgi:predicted ATP-dependent endonuclease of OLD family
MKLTSAQIKNFRSIDDSSEFTVGELTCFVGKNESGKTALLQALEKINPQDAKQREFDKYRDGLPPKSWTIEKCSSAQVKVIFSRFLDR